MEILSKIDNNLSYRLLRPFILACSVLYANSNSSYVFVSLTVAFVCMGRAVGIFGDLLL